jgi:hypothetical protein
MTCRICSLAWYRVKDQKLKLETHISLSLTLSTSCQSSSQITAPVHSPSVNRPSNYLIPILYLFIYLAPLHPSIPVSLLAPLHPSISTCSFIFCTSTIPVFNCYIAITSPLWPIYCLTSLILPHLHILVLLYYWLYVYYSMCNCVVVCVELLCCMCRTALLHLGQVAVANENLFSTSLPG